MRNFCYLLLFFLLLLVPANHNFSFLMLLCRDFRKKMRMEMKNGHASADPKFSEVRFILFSFHMHSLKSSHPLCILLNLFYAIGFRKRDVGDLFLGCHAHLPSSSDHCDLWRLKCLVDRTTIWIWCQSLARAGFPVQTTANDDRRLTAIIE